MSTDIMSRKRSVDVERLDTEQVEQLTEQISKKILAMVDETVDKANKMLNVYGLEAKMQIAILKKETSEE